MREALQALFLEFVLIPEAVFFDLDLQIGHTAPEAYQDPNQQYKSLN